MSKAKRSRPFKRLRGGKSASLASGENRARWNTYEDRADMDDPSTRKLAEQADVTEQIIEHTVSKLRDVDAAMQALRDTLNVLRNPPIVAENRALVMAARSANDELFLIRRMLHCGPTDVTAVVLQRALEKKLKTFKLPGGTEGGKATRDADRALIVKRYTERTHRRRQAQNRRLGVKHR